ncbi:hypothetical protein ACQJBY_055882 [Aegilops geniculata]
MSPTTTASSDLEGEEGSSHRRGTPGPPRFLDRCDALHDGRPKILRPQEASDGSGASPAKSGQIQWKNCPPARPSDQAPIAEPNGRRAADAVQPSLCFHIASYGIESVFKGFLFLILVHASTEISKYIWSILVFLLMRNVLNNHLNDSNVSSYKSAAPKMTISLKWLKPTNTPKGLYSLFVPNVVSKVTTSPK